MKDEPPEFTANVSNRNDFSMDVPELASDLNQHPEDYTPRLPNPHDGLLPGLMGELVNLICKHSEATPPAVVAGLIARLCTLIGRPCQRTPEAANYRLGDKTIHLRPFLLIVGDTGKGRKGTSDEPVKKLFKWVDEVLMYRHGIRLPAERLSRLEKYWQLNTHSGGLSSGEGVIYALRDDEWDPNTESVIQGQPDKRLLIIESEFGNILSMISRGGNTLSSVIRQLWDGESLSPLTKNNRYSATDPHACILSHVTSHELLYKLKANDLFNGMMNRFMVISSHRPRLVPFPRPTITDAISGLVEQLADIVEFAWTAGEIRMSDESLRYWPEAYHQLENISYGARIDALMSRSSAYCLMLSMLFALMDQRKVIEVWDIVAGLHWVKYWLDSLVFIFDGEREKVRSDAVSSLAQKILEFIREDKALTKTQIHKKLSNHHKSSEIQKALEVLLNATPASIVMEQKPTKGKPVKTYTPAN